VQFLGIGRVSLPEDCSNGKLRCIHFQLELAVLVRGNKYWGRSDYVYEHVKGLAAVRGPVKGGVFLQQVCEGMSKTCEVWYEGSLISEDSEDFSDFFDVS